MPWKCQESCIRTQCFTKNVLDIVSTRLCFIHELWERVGMNSPHTNSHTQSPHFRFEKQIETGQTWCFCTKKKIDWAEATAKAYKWRLWNTGFWLAESIWSQPMALALRFAANPCGLSFFCNTAYFWWRRQNFKVCWLWGAITPVRKVARSKSTTFSESSGRELSHGPIREKILPHENVEEKGF